MKLRTRVVRVFVAVALVSALAAPAASAQSAPFTDVANMTWALPSIQALSLLGVMQGTGTGKFDPSGTTTRAELAVVLSRLLMWPTGTQGGHVVQGTNFNDWSSVPDWAKTAVAIAASRGILQGESDGGVHPNAPVTWAQLAVIAARTFGYAPAPSGLAAGYRASLPAAAGTPAWATSALASDVQAGNFRGILGALYRPNRPVTRAALAVFLTRAAGFAGNPNFLSGQIEALGPGEMVLRAAAGAKSLPVAGHTAVYAGSSASTLSSLEVGDTVSVVLVGGQVEWVDVTSVPERVTVAGTVASVDASGISLKLPGGVAITLPTSTTLTVTVAGATRPVTIASLTAGTPVLATLDGRGRVSVIEVTGPTGSTGSSAPAASGTPAGSGAGTRPTGTNTAQGTSGSTSSGSTASNGSGSTASGSTAAAPSSTTVTALDFSPDPIASSASLSPGAKVNVALDALNGAGHAVAGAVVQISFSAGPGGGSASIGGTLLTSAAQSFVADGSGKIHIVYTAPSAPSGAGSDALVATSVSGNNTVAASDSYVFKPYPSTGAASTAAVASYTFAPSPIASPASITPGQSVHVTLTAEDATGGPVAASEVYLSFAQGQGGGSAWVGSTSLAATPKPFLTDGSGHVDILYTTPVSPPAGTTDTITAANAASNPTLTAKDAYAYGTAATGVAPYATFTASVQSVSGTGLKLLLTNGSTATLIIAPGATINKNGQQAGLSALAVGEQVTVTLNGQEWIDTVDIHPTNGAGGAPLAGYLTAVDTSANTITIYGTGGLHTYWIAQNPDVTLSGQATAIRDIPIGDTLSLSLNASDSVTGVAASPTSQVTTGTVVSVLSNVLTLSNGSTTQSTVLGQYTVAVRGGQLIAATDLPPGTQVVLVPGAATYGGTLIIATS